MREKEPLLRLRNWDHGSPAHAKLILSKETDSLMPPGGFFDGRNHNRDPEPSAKPFRDCDRRIAPSSVGMDVHERDFLTKDLTVADCHPGLKERICERKITPPRDGADPNGNLGHPPVGKKLDCREGKENKTQNTPRPSGGCSAVPTWQNALIF